MSIIMEISKERLVQLLREEYELTALEGYGVDNWVWYDDAMNENGEGTYPSVRELDEFTDDEIIERLL